MMVWNWLTHHALPSAAATIKVAALAALPPLALGAPAIGWWSILWGGLAGSSRWIALKEAPRDGVKSVLVGMVTARAFDGAVFLPLRSWFEMPLASETAATSMIISVMAVTVIREMTMPTAIRGLLDRLKERIGA